jgi:omega-6 fatty acid desaturase (delta-12 desaturase)
MSTMQAATLKRDARGWGSTLAEYRRPHALRAAYELAITAIPFAVTWFLMFLALSQGYIWLYLLLLLPAAGFLVRLFLIQHDCGHRAFVANRHANDWIGRVISVLTLTPYDYWRRTHSLHHATSGNLARRGIGDVDTLTVEEYRARTPSERLRYRIYRHPIVMFGVGPAYLFLLQHRLPMGMMREGWRPWLSTMGTTAAFAVGAGAMIWAIGLKAFLLIHVPIFLVGAAAGVWLFYVQHQFEETTWEKSEDWNVRDAALLGSSYYDLPGVLKWFTANIGVHHVHHLCSQIPYYRLTEVLRDHPELREVGHLTLWQSVKCARLVLWDEASRRLVSFRQLRGMPTPA